MEQKYCLAVVNRFTTPLGFEVIKMAAMNAPKVL
jgi:hypothetical protein